MEWGNRRSPGEVASTDGAVALKRSLELVHPLPDFADALRPPFLREQLLDLGFRESEAYDACRVSGDDGVGRNGLLDDGACTDDNAMSDLAGGRENDGVVSDEDVVPDF